MSIITLQVGQCGNQIGSQLFSLLSNDLNQSLPSWCPADRSTGYADICTDRFFYMSKAGNQLNARAVMVDMEPKVIAQAMDDAKQSSTWCYARGQQVCQRRGSGNNWAHGYCHHGPLVEESVLEAVRRETEKCDMLGGFLTLMSLAGGTGSGVGAFITKCLRDNYPHSFLVNQVVWPYGTGEVAVQNYNAILSLAHLYQSTDAILTMENDSLHRICSQLLALPKVSFKDINSVISSNLASVLMPACKTLTHETKPSYVTSHMGDLLESVASHPEFKMLTVQSIPHISKQAADFSTFQWPGLLKHLRQMIVANAAMEEGINWQVKCGAEESNRCLSNLLILRGNDLSRADVEGFRDKRLYCSWFPAHHAFTYWCHTRPFLQNEKSAVLVSNSQSIVPLLDCVVQKAWKMFASRAYVHQYQRHGLDEDDFVDCFASLEQVLARYRNI